MESFRAEPFLLLTHPIWPQLANILKLNIKINEKIYDEFKEMREERSHYKILRVLKNRCLNIQQLFWFLRLPNCFIFEPFNEMEQKK